MAPGVTSRNSLARSWGTSPIVSISLNVTRYHRKYLTLLVGHPLIRMEKRIIPPPSPTHIDPWPITRYLSSNYLNMCHLLQPHQCQSVCLHLSHLLSPCPPISAQNLWQAIFMILLVQTPHHEMDCATMGGPKEQCVSLKITQLI